MTEIAFLTTEAVIGIHQDQMSLGGLPGFINAGSLDSAAALPRTLHSYGEADVFVLAGVYLYHIARNHPFVDGNKRTAYVAALVFLRENGVSMQPASPEVVEDFMVAVASGAQSKEDVVNYLRALETRAEGS